MGLYAAPDPAALPGISGLPLVGGDYDWNILNLPHNLQVLCADCHDLTKRKKPLALQTAMGTDDRYQLLLPF